MKSKVEEVIDDRGSDLSDQDISEDDVSVLN